MIHLKPKSLRENGKHKGFISFSTSTENLIMLSHYSNDHKGGILEFTIDDIEDGYSNKTNLFKTTNDYYNFGVIKYLIKRKHEAPENYQDHFKTGIMFEKFIEWEHEKEVRYLSYFRGVIVTSFQKINTLY
ncbi:MAG: hypothetical protein Q9N68_08110 [Gammaproteobacteria bacterium]|nr:hypothetical protein [Gammaproteobacteria bacterium]